MSLPIGPTDRDALARAIEAEGRAVGGMLHAARPVNGRDSVPGLEWTVAETAAHLLSVVRRALGDRRRSSTPQDTARVNAESLAALPSRDILTLGMELIRDTAVVARRILPHVLDGEVLIPFQAGIRVRALDAFGCLLGELVVHGHDLAAGLRRPHAVPPERAVLAYRATLGVAHRWLDPAQAVDPPRRFVLDVAEAPYVAEARVSARGLTVTWCEDRPATDRVDPTAALLSLAHRGPSGDPGVDGLADLLLPF
ncbi:hypothetical protein EKO23_05910 [Nocardioides guangzhouensis]|uniref:Mycothiol-dependent maleylpyruvate isomerase metal-binding domain-containing protein n=1 Tax=Nocardioides guangzhouensis TaxID=2497878 RepID=A0A4Q4ZH65_9ACTN|nr:hypothetical protein [Nocardioides guangzhouensis]RYP87567.1 hypothetical protein EKO23_05910 [Nocardioides guangzhouensis]